MSKSRFHALSNVVLAGAIVWGVGESSQPMPRTLRLDSITVNDITVRNRLSAQSASIDTIRGSSLDVSDSIRGRSVNASGEIRCNALTVR